MAAQKKKRARSERNQTPARARRHASTMRVRRRSRRSAPSLEAHGPSDAWRGYYRRRRKLGSAGCGLLPDPPPIGTHVIGPDDYDDDDY
jgi:hypothetical protein